MVFDFKLDLPFKNNELIVNLNQRIKILIKLGEYLSAPSSALSKVIDDAGRENGWFTSEFVNLAIQNITQRYLQPTILREFMDLYPKLVEPKAAKKVGLVMAGNIPLVGFHDFLCCFLAGHEIVIKPSSKDTQLIKHIVQRLIEWEPELTQKISLSEMLKGCDAYIATGSNNSGRYFDYYFRNYPSIIRKNRTSAAILTGLETEDELAGLADDMLLFFGLGCRNVSSLFVPVGYDFIPLLGSMEKFRWMADHHKFRNNYDYNLSLLILNNQYYMTNNIVLLVEDTRLFSAISQIHYSYYEPAQGLPTLPPADELQCIAGKEFQKFGVAQFPGISDYADGVDTLQFLTNL